MRIIDALQLSDDVQRQDIKTEPITSAQLEDESLNR